VAQNLWGGNEGRSIYIEREGVLPANEEEQRNDPDLRKYSDMKVKWRTFKNDNMKSLQADSRESIGGSLR